jgi:hypothetical protein
MWFSNLLPTLAKHADKICMLNAISTSQFNHTPAQLIAQTGHNLEWLSFLGLLAQPRSRQREPEPTWVHGLEFGRDRERRRSGLGRLLAHHVQGVLLQATDPILNLGLPPGFPRLPSGAACMHWLV